MPTIKKTVLCFISIFLANGYGNEDAWLKAEHFKFFLGPNHFSSLGENHLFFNGGGISFSGYNKGNIGFNFQVSATIMSNLEDFFGYPAIIESGWGISYKKEFLGLNLEATSGYQLYLFSYLGNERKISGSYGRDSTDRPAEYNPGFNSNNAFSIGKPIGKLNVGLVFNYKYYFPYINPRDGFPYLRLGNNLGIYLFIGRYKNNGKK